MPKGKQSKTGRKPHTTPEQRAQIIEERRQREKSGEEIGGEVGVSGGTVRRIARKEGIPPKRQRIILDENTKNRVRELLRGTELSYSGITNRAGVPRSTVVYINAEGETPIRSPEKVREIWIRVSAEKQRLDVRRWVENAIRRVKPENVSVSQIADHYKVSPQYVRRVRDEMGSRKWKSERQPRKKVYCFTPEQKGKIVKSEQFGRVAENIARRFRVFENEGVDVKGLVRDMLVDELDFFDPARQPNLYAYLQRKGYLRVYDKLRNMFGERFERRGMERRIEDEATGREVDARTAGEAQQREAAGRAALRGADAGTLREAAGRAGLDRKRMRIFEGMIRETRKGKGETAAETARALKQMRLTKGILSEGRILQMRAEIKGMLRRALREMGEI